MREIYKEKNVSTKEQIEFVSRSVSELPEHERVIIYLYFWKELSLKEVAGICDLSLSLTKKILDEAILRLRLNYLIELVTPKKNEALCSARAS